MTAEQVLDQIQRKLDRLRAQHIIDKDNDKGRSATDEWQPSPKRKVELTGQTTKMDLLRKAGLYDEFNELLDRFIVNPADDTRNRIINAVEDAPLLLQGTGVMQTIVQVTSEKRLKSGGEHGNLYPRFLALFEKFKKTLEDKVA